MSQQQIAIQPGTMLIQATNHTNGDGDFDGHGPMMYLTASLYVANEYQLGLNVFVRFEETQSDWTTWQGSYTGIVFDVRGQGGNYKILSVATPPFNDARQLNGYGMHHVDYGVGGIIQSVDAVGDSDGGVFGGDDHPQVNIVFNNITIEVQDPPAQHQKRWFNTKIHPYSLALMQK